MSKEKKGPEKKTKFLRRRDDNFVYHSTVELLKRGDMFACDAEGNFVTTGHAEVETGFEGKSDAEIAAEVKAKANQTKADDLLIAMQTRAKELNIKSAHRMKEETLVVRIAEAEAGLKSGGDKPQSSESSEETE